MSLTHPLVIKLKAAVAKYDMIAKDNSENAATTKNHVEHGHYLRWANYYNGKAQGLDLATAMVSDYLDKNDTTLEEQNHGN